jgi:hypothetical protein
MKKKIGLDGKDPLELPILEILAPGGFFKKFSIANCPNFLSMETLKCSLAG